MKGIIIMKMKLRSRIAAAMTAVVMASSMMMTSASAAVINPGTGRAESERTIVFENGFETVKDSYNVYKVPNGSPSSGAFSVRSLEHDKVHGFKDTKSKFQINCTTFQDNTPNNEAPAKIRYWTYVTLTTDDVVENVIPGGFPAHFFYGKYSSYVGVSLLDILLPENCLQVKVQLEDYSNATTCIFRGDYKVF